MLWFFYTGGRYYALFIMTIYEKFLLNETWVCFHWANLPANIYLFKVNRDTRKRKRCEVCSKVTKVRSGVFIVNFEQISHLFVVSLLFTLNK